MHIDFKLTILLAVLSKGLGPCTLQCYTSMEEYAKFTLSHKTSSGLFSESESETIYLQIITRLPISPKENKEKACFANQDDNNTTFLYFEIRLLKHL